MLRVMLLIVGLSGALAGCGLRDPLGEVPRLSEAEAAALENSVALAERQAEQSGGLRGFWALFGGGNETAPEGEQKSAAEAPAAQQAAPEAAKSPGFFARLFGGGAAATSGEDLLPRACDLSRSQRGRRIASRAGFTLYDSFPHSTAPRPFYVTGFRDGCARQITAALVMFGEAGVYQTGQLYARRGRRSDGFDRAFESLKSRICRVGRGQACGGAQQARFDRAVAMLTAYPRFESSPGGTNILLHDRKVVALSE